MLTSEHSIVVYKMGRAFPDRLMRNSHRHYVDLAEKMLAVYRNNVGLQRCVLHKRIESLFVNEPDCPVRRVQAFCKLLDDKSVFQADQFGKAASLRLKVFSEASRLHPLVERPDLLFENDQEAVKTRLAQKLGMSWKQVDQALYTDVLSYQQLEEFVGYGDAVSLLSRYNVAQLQACLYRAESVMVRAKDDFKTILRYAKLARLLHEIDRIGPGEYRMIFSGPASVLRQTRRYGVRFARFLPALLACKEWDMRAVLRTPWNSSAELVLSAGDYFCSHLPAPEEFDSKLEESFANKFGSERDGWRLIREGAVLHANQKTFVPDFVFRHEDGTEVLFEIVGFWTPEYLRARRQTLRRFRNHRILIAVPERSVREAAHIGGNTLVYKTALKLAPLMQALEAFRIVNQANGCGGHWGDCD